MVFLITLAAILIIFGVLWILAFLWAKNGVPSSKDYANDPAKQAQLLQTPIAGIWRTFLHIPLRVLTAITAVGPFIFFFGLMPVIQGVVWATAPGTVTTSQVFLNDDDVIGYNLQFEYQFTVNGQTYHGRQISFNDDNNMQSITLSTLSKDAATALQTKYPQGSSVIVHYDPQLPLNSALDTQVGTRTLVLLAVAAIATVIGTPFFALFLRARRWRRLYREVAAMQPRDR